jgi:hypothetical protein
VTLSLTQIAARLQAMQARIDELSARTPNRIGKPMPPASLSIQVAQVAHGFTVGKAVTCAYGSWALYTDAGESPYLPLRPLWGIVSAVTGPDSFRLVIGGEGITTSTTLIAGSHYAFANGDPVLVGSTQYPPIEGSGFGIGAPALSASSILVTNDARFQGLRSQDGVYAIVTHNAIGAGHYVVYAGVPSGQTPLALADPVNPWKWTNVGIALFEVVAAHTWLVLVAGTHTWEITAGGDTRPAWMVALPYNLGQRIYLSDTNAGQYAATEPAFKVYAGMSLAGYTPPSPPDPDRVSFSATAVGQGVPYPIPASGGGTGGDISLMNENAVLAIHTDAGFKRIWGYLNVAPIGFLSQAGGGVPSWTLPDIGANHSMEVTGGVLYALVCGQRSANTAPTDKQFLRYSSTTWQPYGPLLSGLGHVLSHDGTDLADVDASTPKSVLGVAGGSAAIPAPIPAGADNTVLGCRSGALTFAQVARAELANGSACSVIGRSANSSGAVADIAAAADGTILTRISNALSFVRNLILGTTSNAGSLTIANPTSATAIDISPALVTTTGKALAVREIDVCDAGAAKKMLVLCSLPY